MATKVKGDAIKEGSIPLSALSSEVKDKIENVGGGADWNAKEGEAGYIKNKPFGEGYEKLEWQYSDEYGCLIAQLQTNKIFINGVEYTLDYQDVTGIYVNGTEYGFLAYDTFIAAFGSDDSVIDTLTNNVFALGESVIDEKYLPDTVLKTTPQTLSDDDKNQALVNLGIDPVVWKYMCNPCIVRENDAVPYDLLDNEGELDNKYAKYPSMFRLDDGISTYLITMQYDTGNDTLTDGSALWYSINGKWTPA